MPARVPVTAVLVAHDGSRWLPEALSALASQTVAPARVVAVDTGSCDDSAALLRRATGSVLELPRTTAYAAAVATALATVPADTRWIWLLHDDCAPARDALTTLLRAAAADPSAAVLGPKVVDWDDPRVLVEIGCTTGWLGVRDSGLEAGELDQGQHDAPRAVLAVGTAGVLIRRDVWDALGGLDAGLAGFRDDLDLGWRANAAGHRVVAVPSARVRHARAATTGRRVLDSAPGRAAAVDREAALQVSLSHATVGRLGWLLPVLIVACLLRALGLLLVRRPRGATDELRALARVVVRPGRLIAGRRARVATRTVPPGAMRPLLSSAWVRARLRAERLLDRGAGRPVPTTEDPDPPQGDALGRLRARPGLLLTAALAVLTLVAARDLLGRGVLVGGRLVAAPEGARDLWSGYAATAEPALAVLAVPATLLLGKASLALDLLLLGALPAAGLVAYAVAGRVVRSPLLQVWAGATWALLPVATGAVAAGRLGVLVVHLVLPALLLAGWRVAAADPRGVGWSPAWALGLALTGLVALAPVLWPLAVLLLVVPALVRVASSSPAHRPAARRRALACAVAALLPALLLLPWSPSLLGPRSLLHGPGRLAPDLADPLLPAWHLLLLQPGGPGTPALLLTLPLLLAALGGLLRTRRAPLAAAGWGVALVGLLAAGALARTTVDEVPVWPGVPLQLAAAGMLLAALVGAEGLQGSLARSSFGWRQLTAVAVVVAAAAFPAAAAAEWVERGAGKPLQRAAPDVLPAFAAAELAADPGRRALLLSAESDGSIRYAVSDAAGMRLGDAPAAVDAPVADLLSPNGTAAAAAVADQGIVFVALAGDSAAATAVLDAQPGLDRQPVESPALWRVVAATRPAPEAPDRLGGLALAAQAIAFLVAAVLAGPGAAPRRGLERDPR